MTGSYIPYSPSMTLCHSRLTSEARRIFENLKLLLEPAGSSLDRLVQVHAAITTR